MARPFTLETEFQSPAKFVQFDGGETVTLNDAVAVFEGEYSRADRDLKIEAPDGTIYKIIDYFSQATPPAIITTSGAMLSGSAVEALAGPEFPGQLSQAGKSVVAAGKLVNIGKVQTLDGEATIKRADGTVVKLKVGEQVFQGDVVETSKSGKVSITFTDGSIFAVSENARMVLDKMVYDPSGSSNSMLFNLIQGTFSFIAGKIASTGKMEVETPVATMGIRGTTIVASVEAVSGATRFSLVNDPDGTSGSFSIFNKQTGALIGSLTSTDKSLFVQTITSTPVEIPRDAAAEQSAVDHIYRAYQDFQRRGDADLDPNNQNNLVQKASFQSSGIGDQPDPSDPLQSFQSSTVNNIVPLGGGAEGGTLPGGTDGPVSSGEDPVEASETTSLTPVADDPGPPVPLPPVFNIPSLTLSVSEDGSINVTGFSLSTSNDNPISVTITAQSTVTLGIKTGLTFQLGDGTADETVQFTGSALDIENALNSLTYFPTPNNDGDGGLTIQLDDGAFVIVAEIDVDITPSPDDPIANDDNFAVVEGDVLNGDITADNGNGIDLDPDTGDSFTIHLVNGATPTFGSALKLPQGGELTLSSDGTFSYTPSDSLGQGDTIDETFTYTMRDTTGRTDNATVTIKVTGVNDPASISGSATGTVTEDASPNTTSGKLTVLDADDSEAGVAAQTNTNGTYGTFTIVAAGDWTYTLDNSRTATDVLSSSEEATDMFVVTSLDGTASETVEITIKGLTDQPNQQPTIQVESLGADIARNGGFETGPAASGGLSLGSTAITDWKVIQASIDYVKNAWTANDGSSAVLDLHGSPSSGGIATDLSTEVGKTYVVTFDVAGNPVVGTAASPQSTVNNLLVTAKGKTQNLVTDSQDVAFNEPTGASNTNLGWQTEKFVFTAVETTTTLSFLSQDLSSFGGPALDNVRVQEVVHTGQQDQPTFITGISIADPDAGTSTMTVTLSAANGILNVNDAISGGVAPSDIQNNGTKTVTLVGTLAEINSTLSSSNGLSYSGDAGFSGFDTLEISANDGADLAGPGLTDTREFSLFVKPELTDGWIALNPDAYPTYTTNKTNAAEDGFTEFLGRFGDSNGQEAIRKTFDIDLATDSVTIQFDFYEINSWDGADSISETFNVFADKNPIPIISDLHHSSFNSLIQNHAKPVPTSESINGAPAELGFLNGFAGSRTSFSNDQIWRYEFTIETNGSKFELGFGAKLSPPLTDEAFGIDNLTIVENTDTLLGTTDDDILRDLNGAVDVIRADDGDDTIVLEATVNTSNEIDAKFTEIDGGMGQDTLRLDDAGDLDLTKIDQFKLKSIEQIDLKNGQQNRLTLSLEDVLDMSDTTNLELDGVLGNILDVNNQPVTNFDPAVSLIVSNDGSTTGDQVILGSEWSFVGTVNINSQLHSVYDAPSGAILAAIAIEADAATTGGGGGSLIS